MHLGMDVTTSAFVGRKTDASLLSLLEKRKEKKKNTRLLGPSAWFPCLGYADDDVTMFLVESSRFARHARMTIEEKSAMST